MGGRGNDSALARRGTETYLQWRRRWHDEYGITPDYDLDEGTGSLQRLTSGERQQLETELGRFAKAFPEVKDMHISISLEDSLPPGSEHAAAMYEGDVSHISITNKLFDNDAYATGLNRDWYAGVLTSFHPQGTTSVSLLSHELAHGLVNYVARVTTPDTSDYATYLTNYSRRLETLENDITEKAAKAVGSSHVQLSSRISHYATYDRGETISEAVMDYVTNGRNANAYSKAIVKELRKVLRNKS